MTHLDPKAAQLEDGAAELSSIIVDVRAGRFTNHAALADRLVAIVDRNRAALAALPHAEPVGWVTPDILASMKRGKHVVPGWKQSADFSIPLYAGASPTPAVSREVTEEMVERAMDRAAWTVKATPSEYEGGTLIDPGMSQEEADHINDQLRIEMRDILEAALSEPHHG